MGPGSEVRPRCFLAEFSEEPCEGRLRAVHLIPKQTLRRASWDPWDPRSFVPACGGIMGLSGCHGRLDAHQITIPPEKLPPELIELAEESGLIWYLERRYGYAPS